ncbi:MAG: hypothetical protein EAZ06_10205 [Cytophagales bacterium]|nr:MAG: hypothetical protein EAZ06_10205 [Cytophagales bacterium]
MKIIFSTILKVYILIFSCLNVKSQDLGLIKDRDTFYLSKPIIFDYKNENIDVTRLKNIINSLDTLYEHTPIYSNLKEDYIEVCDKRHKLISKMLKLDNKFPICKYYELDKLNMLTSNMDTKLDIIFLTFHCGEELGVQIKNVFPIKDFIVSIFENKVIQILSLNTQKYEHKNQLVSSLTGDNDDKYNPMVLSKKEIITISHVLPDTSYKFGTELKKPDEPLYFTYWKIDSKGKFIELKNHYYRSRSDWAFKKNLIFLD